MFFSLSQSDTYIGCESINRTTLSSMQTCSLTWFLLHFNSSKTLFKQLHRLLSDHCDVITLPVCYLISLTTAAFEFIMFGLIKHWSIDCLTMFSMQTLKQQQEFLHTACGFPRFSTAMGLLGELHGIIRELFENKQYSGIIIEQEHS